MPAGRLNKRVRFEREEQSPDGAGGYDLAWLMDFICWGGLQLERGREKIDAGRIAESTAGVLTIRSSNESRALTTSHRVIIDEEEWNVRSIANEDQRNKYLSIVVEKGGAT
jgi:head-tail adaptor